MNFKNNLKKLRQLNNLTQQNIADLIGINLQSYQKYEQGDREPKFNILEKIKIALNCTYDDLLEDCDEIDIKSCKVKWYVSLLRKTLSFFSPVL